MQYTGEDYINGTNFQGDEGGFVNDIMKPLGGGALARQVSNKVVTPAVIGTSNFIKGKTGMPGGAGDFLTSMLFAALYNGGGMNLARGKEVDTSAYNSPTDYATKVLEPASAFTGKAYMLAEALKAKDALVGNKVPWGSPRPAFSPLASAYIYGNAMDSAINSPTGQAIKQGGTDMLDKFLESTLQSQGMMY